MEEITPVTRTIKKVEGEKGTRFHCLGPHNPHYYMKNGVLRPIDVLAVSKDQITTGKQLADIRGSHVVSVGLNKADTYEKCIGFRRDDKQDGSEQFEITYLGATYNDIAYSSDPYAKEVIDPLTNRIGNLHVFSNRHRTRLALPATNSVSKFRIQFKIHTVGLTAKQVGQDFHFINAAGKFRFGLRKPSILGMDYEPYKLVQDKTTSFPYAGAVAHHLEDLGGGEYLYTKESTDLFKGLPSEYLIDAETVYASSADGYIYSGSNSWDTAHSTGVGSDDISDMQYVGCKEYGSSPRYRIWRTFLLFDTSALTGTVVSGSMGFYSGGEVGDPVFIIQQGSQGDTLTTGDFNAFSGNSGGSVTITSSGDKTLTLNSTGCSIVAIGGTTYLCFREYNHDFLNNSYDLFEERVNFYFQENYRDPYLSLKLSPFTPRIIMVC